MTATNATFLKRLETKQGSETDAQFAKRLGISRQLWQMVRTRRKPIALGLLKGVIRTYPELECEVLAFLRDGHEKGSKA